MSKKRIFNLLILIFFCVSTSWAIDNDNKYSFSPTMAKLRDTVYAQIESLDVVQALYEKAEREVEASNLGQVDKLNWLAQVQFYYGRYFRMNNIFDKAEVELEKALAITDKSLAIKRSSEACRIKSDIYGQLVAFKERSYVLKVGITMRKLAAEAVELDPSNGKAWLVHAYSYAFAPKIVGGDPNKALSYLDNAIESANIELDDVHNIYKTIGVCYDALGDKELALSWLNKAKDIYPKNWYILETIDEVKNRK